MDEAQQVAHDVDRLARREERGQPGLRQLVEDDDRRREAEERAPVRSAHAAAGPPAMARSAIVTLAPDSSTVTGSARAVAGRGRARGDLVGQGLAGDVAEMRLDLGRQAVEPQPDPRVEIEAGVLAQVLDRALELAGIALGDERRRELGVDDDDEALVVRDGRPGQRAREDLDLVGRQRLSGERHRAVRVDLELARARGGHDRRDRRAEPLADLRKERPDAAARRAPSRRRSRSSAFTLSSSEMRSSSSWLTSMPRSGHRDPRARERLPDADPGLGAERPGELDRRAARRPSIARAARRGGRPSPAAGQRVRWTLSASRPSGHDRHDEVLVQRPRP